MVPSLGGQGAVTGTENRRSGDDEGLWKEGREKAAARSLMLAKGRPAPALERCLQVCASAPAPVLPRSAVAGSAQVAAPPPAFTSVALGPCTSQGGNTVPWVWVPLPTETHHAFWRRPALHMAHRPAVAVHGLQPHL